MHTRHSIAHNIITKALLPFVLTLLLFGIFSCKKQIDLDRFIGTYNGQGCGRSYIEDTANGGGEFVSQCEASFVEVIIDPDRNDKLRIVFNGKKDVKLQNDLSFDDGDGFQGEFFGDSLRCSMSFSPSLGFSFRGKKQ